MPQANGTFDVKLTPQHSEDKDADAVVGLMSITKQFHGDLQATSKGHMLAIGTAVKGSAGYVAMERVTGALHGQRGSFALQHSGSMDRGTPSLTVSVVPDSGTEGLAGISGTLGITVVDGKHLYTLDYALPTAN